MCVNEPYHRSILKEVNMESNIYVRKDFVEDVTICCTPTEYLVIKKALKALADIDCNEIDRKMAEKMFKEEPNYFDSVYKIMLRIRNRKYPIIHYCNNCIHNYEEDGEYCYLCCKYTHYFLNFFLHLKLLIH